MAKQNIMLINYRILIDSCLTILNEQYFQITDITILVTNSDSLLYVEYTIFHHLVCRLH